MKKYAAFIILIILCAGLIISCGEKETEKSENNEPKENSNNAENVQNTENKNNIININIRELYDAIKEKIDFSEHDDHGYDEFERELIKALFSITTEEVTDIITIKKIDFNNAFNEEILILAQSENNDKAKETAAKLEKYKEQKLKTLTDYSIQGNEEQYYLVEASEIKIEQNYVFWVVDKRRKEINEIIAQYIQQN